MAAAGLRAGAGRLKRSLIRFGLLLLFLARGIYLRIDAAWYGSILLLALGIIVSVLKGLDWHEAGVLALMLALFLPARGYFRRPSSLFNMPLFSIIR